MIDPKVIRNYASCLFKNIESEKSCKIVLEQIQIFSDLMQGSNSLSLVLCSPICSFFHKIKLVDTLAEKLKFEQITKQFLKVVIKNTRLIFLPAIIDEYKKILNDNLGIKSVVVESVTKLGKKEIDIIKDHLENKLDKSVKIEVQLNKSLIGGVVIKHDSLLYDYSIAGAIEKVAKIARDVRL